MVKFKRYILFSDKLENSDDTLKNSLQNVKKFHFTNTFGESPFAEPVLRKVIPTLGPKLNKFCLVSIPRMCFDFIVDFIELRKSTLKELNFMFCNISDDFLETISLIKELNLTSFSLRGCKESTNVGLRKLCKSQKNIKELDLNFWEGLSDESLIIISDILPNIRILRMESCRDEITNVSLLFYFLFLFLLHYTLE